jgi:hypothetical protein
VANKGYVADVVVIKFGFAMLHRFLSNRRGRRRERPSNEQNPEECDATADAMKNCSWLNKKYYGKRNS